MRKKSKFRIDSYRDFWISQPIAVQKKLWQLFSYISERSYRRGVMQGIMYERRGLKLPDSDAQLLKWRSRTMTSGDGLLGEKMSAERRFDEQNWSRMNNLGIQNPNS